MIDWDWPKDVSGHDLSGDRLRVIACTRSGRRREAPLVDDATRIEAARLIARRLLHDYMRLRTELRARPGDRAWRHDVDERGGIVSQVLSI